MNRSRGFLLTVLLHDSSVSRALRKNENPGKAPSRRASPGFIHLSLVVQLQRKLNLARIVGFKPRRSDLAEVRVVEVARTADRHYAIAAEVGRVEVGMVEDVEELSTEFRRDPLGDRELLEDREVETMNAGAYRVARFGTQGGRATERDAAGRRIGYGSKVARSAAQLAGLVEGLGIVQPERPRLAVDHLRLDATLLALTGKQYSATAGSRNAPGRTAEIQGLPALGGHDPVDRPSAQNGIGDSTLVQIPHAFPDGQLVTAAEVDHVADVEVRRPPVEPGPESRNAQSSKWTTVVAVA